MDHITHHNKKLKAITNSIGIPNHQLKPPTHNISKSIKHSPSHYTQINPNNNDLHNTKLPKLHNTTTPQDSQFQNNQFIEPHLKDKIPSRQQEESDHLVEHKYHLAEHKYHLPESALQHKKAIILNFKKELINRDKEDHPFKYKIVNEQLGFNPEKIYKLKHAELSQIQEQYQKHKGIEYLREARQHHNHRSKIQTSNQIRSKGVRTRTNSEKLFRENNPALEELREKEDIMGRIVYQRVKRYLKQEKLSSDFSQRVHSQEAIDRALIDFVKLKIERAETSLKHV